VQNNAFLLKRKERIEDVDSDVALYVHKKTGARVLNMANNDDNKLFSIAFNTPTKDDSGVFHIIEHSVLSGSRKYKSKDAFVDSYKSSLATFMNAMTWQDVTMYPFSTRNERDFFNLMDVYLDAVFFPRLHENPDIFYREGHHYELFSKDDPIRFNGVVYNEMKGTISNRLSRLMYASCKAHYKNHCYAFNSGGDPEKIVELSHENVCESHKKYYHPSNAFVFVYGDVDIEKVLSLLDEQYFSQFEKRSFNIQEEMIQEGMTISNIKVAKSFASSVWSEGCYPISEEDDDSQSLISIGYHIDDKVSFITSFIFNILKDVLGSSPSSPLRLAVLEKSLAKELYPVWISRRRNDFFIMAEEVDEKKKEEFCNLVDEVLKELVEKGIDKNILKGSLTSLEMEWMEANTANSHGLFYLFNSLDSWYFGEDIFEMLKIKSIMKELHNMTNTNFFEDFISKHFLDSKYKSFTILSPSKTKGKEDEMREEKRLEEYKKSLSEEKIEELIHLNKRLEAEINRTLSEEEKQTIPHLQLSDIKKDIWNCYHNVEKEGDVTLLTVEKEGSDIVYFDFAFDLASIAYEKLPVLSFLTDLLTQMNTSARAYYELANEIAIHTGGTSFFPEVIENKHTKGINLKIIWNIKAIVSKVPTMLHLMQEIATQTLFENEERIKEVLEATILRCEAEFINRGNVLATSRLASYFLKASKYASLLGGLDYLKFLKELKANFDERICDFKKELQHFYRLLFCKNDLVISLSASKKNIDAVKHDVFSFANNLSLHAEAKAVPIGELIPLNEGIACESDVLYVAKGYDIEEMGGKYSGKHLVLCNILNSGYLYNNIRAKGGAYGAGIRVYSNRALIASSYRDPHLKETLKVYDEIEKYLASFDASNQEMESYIIGSLKEFYTPIFPESEAIRALRLYLSGRNNDDIMKIIDEALVTSKDDIRGYADLVQKVFAKNYLCVLGNEKKIREEAELFLSVVRL